ncbi:MAG: biopolymer transporter ExbD [Gemmatales bacterium]|nr:biopolymer transporter ExbD [Gemmatales bacterium]MDW8175736.1 biopolymer transporter ExbD [Gemmatales bacterium]
MTNHATSWDVWLSDQNTVYTGVPLSAVCDWIVDGRLLPQDRARPSGNAAAVWLPLPRYEWFAPYFVAQTAPAGADDAAEAHEAVELGLELRKEEDEGEVDLVPLIDISMVLLIFFTMMRLMSAAQGATQSRAAIPTPEAENGYVVEKADMITIGLNVDEKTQALLYYVNEEPVNPNTEEQMLYQLRLLLEKRAGEPRVILRAHEHLPTSAVKHVLARLQEHGIKTIAGEVRDKYRKR